MKPSGEKRMAKEQKPLLATVRVAPAPLRARSFSRFVALVLGSGLIYFSLSFFLLPNYGPDYIASLAHSKWHKNRVPLAMLEEIMLLTPDENKAREHSRYYSSGAHLGGKNLSQAIWTKERWEEYGIPEVEIVAYDIYTNYPKSHRLGLLKAHDGSSTTYGNHERIDGRNYELLYEAGLSEEVLEEDPTTGVEDRIPTFHGYSANGNVTAEYLFANYGTFQDFEDLLANGVNFTGKVVICKYGSIFRGLKVKRAQDLGAVGVLIYSDPGDDGLVTELNGYKPYPDGPARNENSVQRGSVQFLSLGPGDPTTPGYASKPGVPRQDPSGFIPSIPSLPISYVDALPLLQSLNNHGLNSSDLGKHWHTGGLYHKNVTYNVGPAPGIVVNLVNEVEYVITPHWDVIGKIPGYIADETIVLGNHRDAWIVGGAGDPNSGSTALQEMARSFGKMLAVGWKPARTIILASWDGEEYGLLGSTEWVEDHQKLLRTSALAYINVDVGARSSVFGASANPLLHDTLRTATSKVADPNSVQAGDFNRSVFDVWDKRISTLGSGSDYTAFQDYLGIPSIDMGFSGSEPDSAVYHYHSNYDSFHWMNEFGDPGYHYHVAMSKIWGLIILSLAETPIVPFNATAYGHSLYSYLANIENLLSETSQEAVNFRSDQLSVLKSSISTLSKRAKRFDARAARIASELAKPMPWWRWWRRAALWARARDINQKYKFMDRAFIYPGGLDDRTWFKHVVYAPGKWTGYAGDTFPGLVESVNDGNWTNAIRWSNIIQSSVQLATERLV